MLGGQPESAESWNRYAYARGNRLRYTDPNGRDIVDFRNALAPATVATGQDLAQFGKDIVHYDAVREAFKGFGDAPLNEKAMATSIGMIAIVDVGANAFEPEEGAAIEGGTRVLGQIHHIATDKAIKSGFTKEFKAIFEKAGLSLQDAANKMFLATRMRRHLWKRFRICRRCCARIRT